MFIMPIDSLVRQGGRAFRFAIVGGVNFLLTWSLLWCFTGLLHWPYLLSTVVAFMLGTLLGHRGNRSFTFRAGDQAYFPQLRRYTLATLSTLGLSLLMMWVLVELCAVHYLIANLCIAAILAGLSFWMNSKWVFGARRAQERVATTTNSLNRNTLPTHLGNGNE